VAVLGAVTPQKVQSTPPAAWHVRSLAVLPFQNLTRDPNDDFFSDGTTEALITNLAQIRELGVISRTTAMRYKGTTKSVPEIGRELGVDAVLAGSVQRAGGHIRITVQLISAARDRHLWAREYERELADVLKLEAEIAQTIAQEIRAHVSSREARRLASAQAINPDAHEAFLIGRYYLRKDNEADVRLSIEYFNNAIRLQGDYALAYAYLSFAWRTLWARGFSRDPAPFRRAAETAIALDPGLGEGHGAMFYEKLRNWDWNGAETEALRAIETFPDFEGTYSGLLSLTGRHAEAISTAERFAKRDPLFQHAHIARGLALYYARRYDDALVPLKRALDLEPRFFQAISTLGAVYGTMGHPSAALQVFSRPEFQESPHAARAYALLGRREDARKMLNGLFRRNQPLDVLEVAHAYFALGDRERGFEWLTKAFDERAAYVPWINVNPAYDQVRSDPQFQTLVARLKLPN
jgi:TolB-like protein